MIEGMMELHQRKNQTCVYVHVGTKDDKKEGVHTQNKEVKVWR